MTRVWNGPRGTRFAMPILQLETYVLEIWKSLGSGVPLTEVIPEGETL